MNVHAKIAELRALKTILGAMNESARMLMVGYESEIENDPSVIEDYLTAQDEIVRTYRAIENIDASIASLEAHGANADITSIPQ